MYRQYENPRELEKELVEMKTKMETLTNEDERISLYESIREIEDRVNHAWQDEEYDIEDCYWDDWEPQMEM